MTDDTRLERVGELLFELERRVADSHFRELELRLRLASAGLDSSAPDGAMTANRVRALENACDAAREALRPDASGDKRRQAVKLCDLARRAL